MTTRQPLALSRGRLDDLEPTAVVDIGSNSVRLVVYEGARRSPAPLFNEKVLCGLGRSVASTGRLGSDAVELALGALTRFGQIIKILKVRDVRAIATAAVRDAQDGAAFLAMGARALGVPIELLSGNREAELAAQGIRMGFLDPDGLAGDLGGGSLELIDVDRGRLRDSVTLPLGGLTLIDKSGNKLDKAASITDAALAAVPWLAKGKRRTFYAVGGTWRALAKLHMEQTRYPLRVMQGYVVPTPEIIRFCEQIRRTRKQENGKLLDAVSRPRREALPYGALVLERVLRRLEPSEVVFSVFGIREGLLFGNLSPAEQKKDPLIAFCEDYARLRSRSFEHARELGCWTAPVFARRELEETPDEKRLREAACLLSDIGWRAHPDYRAEQSINVIAHAALAGIDHPGRIFLALTVYYRHVGNGREEARDMLLRQLKERVGKKSLKRARILGAALRTAHMISIGVAGVIGETAIGYERGKLVLTLPRRLAGLDGERLRRRLAGLGSLVDSQTVIRIS
ncbi:MAG: exopolyphosphatase [Hyphomicrobiaceae bacterium]